MRQGKREREKILIKGSLSLYLLFFILIRFSFSQHREEIILPDSLGGINEIGDITYNEIEDRIYLTSPEYEQTVVAIDCEKDERIFPIKLEGEEVTYYHKILWHKNNNCIYLIRGKSYNWDVYWDSILIFDGHNHQRIKSIPLPPNLKDADFSFISNYVNNKLYLYAKSDEGILFLIIDGSQNRIIEERDISRYNPVKLIFNPYNNFIYFLSDSCLRKVYLFSCELDSVIDSISLSPDLWWNEYSAHLFLDSLRNHLIITGLKDRKQFMSIYIIDYHTNQIVDSLIVYLYPRWYVCEYNFRQNKLYFFGPYYSNQIGILDIEQRTVDTVTFDYAVECVIYNHHNDIVYCDILWEDIVLVDGRTNRIIGTISTRDVTEPPIFCHPKRNKVYTNLSYFGELGVIDGNQNIVKKYVKYGCEGVDGDISYNPLTNKIYVAERFAPYIIILDGETHRTLKIIDTYPLTGQIYFWFSSSAVCTALNKIYFSTSTSILVMDGIKDSIVKVINGFGRSVLTYNPFNNKLYAVRYFTLLKDKGKKRRFLENKEERIFEPKEDFICIIDCNTDSILKVLPILGRSYRNSRGIISPDGSKIYFHTVTWPVCEPQRYYVVCGFGDTLIKRLDSLGGRGAFKQNSDTLYIGYYGYCANLPQPPPLVILDWKKDSIISKIDGVGGGGILYNPINNYLYSASFWDWRENKLFVIDCATNSVVDTIFKVSPIRGEPWDDAGLLIWNPITNKIYMEKSIDTIGNIEYHTIKVIDCRTNRIIKTIPMPIDFRLPYAFNPRQNCLYFGNIYQSKLIVIRDELTGIYSNNSEKKEKYSFFPTIGKDFNIILKEKEEIVVYNSIGRKVKSFFGENISIKELKKGIYFIRLKREKEIKKIIVINDL